MVDAADRRQAGIAPAPRRRLGASASDLHAGTVFNYILTRAATVKVAIKHKGGKTVATLTRSGRKGKNALPFSGRILGKALSPGNYTAVLPRNQERNARSPRRSPFASRAAR